MLTLPIVCSSCDKMIPTDIDKESQIIYIGNKPIYHYAIHSNGCNECIPCVKKREKRIRETGSNSKIQNHFQNINISIINE